MAAVTGQAVQYVSPEGYAKAAIVVLSSEDDFSVAPESVLAVRPEDGHAHLIVFSITEGVYRPRLNVPCREMAESIPDYRIDGRLVGYYKEIR